MAALDALTDAATQQRNSNFAVAKELRKGRAYRQENPPRPIAGAERLGFCEQCEAWLPSFDVLVHHQFTHHAEIFAPLGELAFEAEPCLCSSCSPAAFGTWCRESPENILGPLPKATKATKAKR